MKDFKVLFVLFVLFCSQGVWAQKWEAPNWKNFSYPVIDFKDKAAGTKGAQIYRRIVPEPEAFIQQHALWVAQTLYWSATDSMPGVEKIEYNLEDTDGIPAKGGQPPVVNNSGYLSKEWPMQSVIIMAFSRWIAVNRADTGWMGTGRPVFSWSG